MKQSRELVLACPAFRSHVNFSRLIRLAGCCAIEQVITCGTGKVDSTIARDGIEQVQIKVHRSLPPVLKKYHDKGFELVGLEQTTASQSLHEFQFSRRSLLVIGHERNGISDEVLQLLDKVVEIPVYGRPFSYNVVTAASMCLYEYCRQFPEG